MTQSKDPIARRFRGYLPVVVDLETGGFNSATDALLEFAAVLIEMDEDGFIVPAEKVFFNVEPFEGANIEQSSLEFTGIDPDNPLRGALPEREVLLEAFRIIRKKIRDTGCHRAIMVAHNASFDLGFLMQAAERAEIKRNPFHPFSSFDTATLCGLAFGQTVLAKACAAADIPFDAGEAHSAIYDCEKTADLFCHIVNRWRDLGGWD
ncbi:MAG: ribonuclease T [Pseudomonadales bacterium]|jgi:ribonuclease T